MVRLALQSLISFVSPTAKATFWQVSRVPLILGHFSSTGKLASSILNSQPINMAILGQSEASNMGRGAYDTTGTVKQPEQPRPTK
ncbi:hypothetical protein P3342_003841 [Pyrenophora teres f. teres]|nr:hypothetical protein HRS9139_02286 [Pyrenophora teres f. teres]CAA9958912.1 hypothetical protein PTMSG1_02444 [Pyrenophora teres f. maculata]KAE8852021.1 hypothetical protein HRS9122_02308 [Pyrenophora teres f. teres]KAE8870691.1 hypothetical protein PTNB29_01035 [Pyrenophora teres f. teres]KAE8874407.1 hypothetical protein PTNB73_01039 [Pyrenophora teres f. teres]